MIGEPEIDGGWDTAHPVEEAEPDLPREHARGPRAPWRWALGGVVAASAVWAGTLAMQDRFTDSPRIDYRHSAELCKESPLKTLGQTVGRTFEGAEGSEGVSPAQDWAYCRARMTYEEDSVSYGAEVQVQLHKRTDPVPEFATGPGNSPYAQIDPAERREVSGLGERAVIDRYHGFGGVRLMVLDGGAVFSLTVHWFLGDEEGSAVDGDAVDAALIEDARALMAKLRR
ncbi:hypothetical protein [Streptomyces sp. H34-S4]|uniref:hypothetical protein n=1 Tax=Streptomyces sp. H34-S4 TaxID=2996463 RepID=UPI0022700055|nr:hypothetical protein [Streptomyces sp. H34-S4]MCY0932686.1 hypothetical protein [Streptomyces sp. H34-S4]